MSAEKRLLKKGFIFVLSFVLVASLILPSMKVEAHGWGRLKNQDKFLEKIFERAREVLRAQERLRFRDWQDAQWALGAIARLKALGIISGYPEDFFKPQDTVKQVEALAMMARAFGMEDEAQELAKKFSGFYTSLYDDDHTKGKGKSSVGVSQDDDDATFITTAGVKLPFVRKSELWGLGYVLLAVDQGWVSLSEIEPAKPATRVWIAKVMVRALGYRAEAEAKMNSHLPFSDASAIPQDSVGYVAQALEMGLFQGYEDNTFRPQKPVTRAEMAAILDRFVQGEMPDETPYLITGTVTKVENNYITLALSSGRSVTYRISQDVLVMFQKQKAELDDVLVGDKVQVLTNGEGVVLLIEVKSRTSPSQGQIFVGSVTAKATNQDGQIILTLSITNVETKTILLARDCKVFYGSLILSPQDILFYDKVKIEVKDGLGVRVDILEREDDSIISGQISGTISAITLSSEKVLVTIKDARGKEQTVELRSDCRISYGTQTLDVGDLALGDQVTLYLENRLAYRLVVTVKSGSPGEFTLGTVHEIYLTSTGTTLKVKDENGNIHAYRLSANVRVSYGTQVLGPEDIGWGDTVRLRLQGDVVTEVVITQRYQGPKDEFQGVVSAITTGAEGNFITIKPVTGEARRVSVNEATKVTYGSSILRWTDIRLKDKVKIRAKNDLALEVEILDRDVEIPFGDIGGQIKAISQTATETQIVIEENALTYTVRLTAQTIVTYGDTRLDRFQLRIGDRVRCRLENQICVEVKVVSRGSLGS